jgi:DNA (cytosine-5)-methyltransferase 3A
MNVLSLFDGMSCGQQALEKCGIKIENYYASEIDKYAIQVTMDNYPNTIQLGSVIDVDVKHLHSIDLLIGGSPCQSFSFAGRRKGMSTKDSQEILTIEHYLQLKEEGYEFEGQSYLFWEYMRILNDIRSINPNVKFLLENVMMGKKWQSVLTKAIGVEPICINSSLVSAQNRRRLYWTNIGLEPMGMFGDMVSIVEQPEDKNILLKDILQEDVEEKYFLSQKAIDYVNRDKRNLGFQMDESDEKSKCITAVFCKQIPYNQIVVHNMMPRSSKTGKGGTGPLKRIDGKTYCLDTKNSNAIEMLYNNKRLNKTIEGEELEEDCLIDSYNKTIHKDKSITISTRVSASNSTHIYKQSRIRKLTPIECERLQTIKDDYTKSVSNSQRYKMIGNGWTVDVIAHIFSYIKK